MAGESWAVQFRLRTKAKHRGYVERTEVTGQDGGDSVPYKPLNVYKRQLGRQGNSGRRITEDSQTESSYYGA